MNVWGFHYDGTTKVTAGPSHGQISSSRGLLSEILYAAKRLTSWSAVIQCKATVKDQILVHENSLMLDNLKNKVITHYKRRGRTPPSIADLRTLQGREDVVMPINGDAIYDAFMGDAMPLAISAEHVLYNAGECDVAYIVDFETEELEIHIGTFDGRADYFAKTGRYVNDPSATASNSKGVRHIASIKLRDILVTTTAPLDIADQVYLWICNGIQPSWEGIIYPNVSAIVSKKVVLTGITNLAVL